MISSFFHWAYGNPVSHSVGKLNQNFCSLMDQCRKNVLVDLCRIMNIFEYVDMDQAETDI